MAEKASEIWAKIKPFAVRDLAGIGSSTGASSGGGGGGIAVHDLDGAYHVGTLSWAKVSKLGSSLADLSAREANDLTATGGTDGDVLGVDGSGLVVYETPSADGTPGGVLMRTDSNGALKVKGFEIERIGGGNPVLTFDGGFSNAAIEFDALGPELVVKAGGDQFLRFNASSHLITMAQTLVTTQRMETAGYVGGGNELRFDYSTGVGNMHTLYVDNLIAEKFVAGVKLAQVGNVTVGHSMALLSRDYTIPAKGSFGTMYVKNLPGVGNYQAFKSSDRLLIQFINIDASPFVVGTAYFRIASSITISGDEQSFNTEYLNVSLNSSALAGHKIYAETTVVSLSSLSNVATGGYWEASTLDTATSGGPFDQIVTMSSPNTSTLTLTPVLRSGYLGGMGKVGGGTFNTGDLGFWFSPAITDNTKPAFYVTTAGANTMRNIDIDLYHSPASAGGAVVLGGRLTAGNGLVLRAATSISLPSDENLRGIRWATGATLGTDYAQIFMSESAPLGLTERDLRLMVDANDASKRAAITLFAGNGPATNPDGAQLNLYSRSNTSAPSFQVTAVDGTLAFSANVTATGAWSYSGDQTMTGGKLIVFNPASAPSGSYFAVTDPASSLAVIMYGAGGGGGEWEFRVDKNNGDLLFRDRPAGVAAIALGAGDNEVRFNNSVHVLKSVEANFKGTLLLSASGQNLTGNSDSSLDFVSPDPGQGVITDYDKTTVSLSTVSWGRSGILGFNMYLDRAGGSPFDNSYGNFRFRGVQSTSTTAGALFFGGNDGGFVFYSSGGNKSDHDRITDWSPKMQITSDGTVKAFGGLDAVGILGSEWSAVTWTNTTYFVAYPGGTYLGMNYKVFGNMLWLRGMTQVAQGWTNDANRIICRITGVTLDYPQIFSVSVRPETSGTTLEKSSRGKTMQMEAYTSGGHTYITTRDTYGGMRTGEWLSFDNVVLAIT